MAKSSDKKITLIPYLSSSIRIFQVVPTTNITMKGLKNEIENDDFTEEDNFTNISLQELSDGTAGAINDTNSADDRPDGTAPHAMSEFASYDHDKTGVGAPGNLSYAASSTQGIPFTYDEGANSTRTEVYLLSYNGDTSYANQRINVDGFAGTFASKYQAVDGSGQNTFTVTGTSLIPGGMTPIGLSLSANQFIRLRLRAADNSGNTSGYTSGLTGYTKVGDPSSLSRNIARTGGNSSWGDGDDGAYTETISWNAPGGGASSYKVTHGPHPTRDNGSNTQDVAVSSGTSLTITGLNNLAQRYGWVAAVGGGGDTGDYVALGGEQITETYFLNIFSSPLLQGDASVVNPPAPAVDQLVLEYSDALSFTTAFSPGNIDCDITNNSGNGILSVAMGTGDPMNGGSNTQADANNGTGWVQEGTTCTLSTGYDGTTSDIVHVRFRYRTHTASGTFDRVATFSDTSDNAEFAVTIQCRTGGKSDRRLKTNIDLVGYSKHFQIPIYTFNYKEDLNTTYKGVMAQDLLEMNLNHAVIIDKDGYYNVLYDLIDVDMETLN